MDSIDSVLGELIFDGKNSKIYRNGIVGDGIQILWRDIEQIYVGGSVCVFR